jgi:hypothetical protein
MGVFLSILIIALLIVFSVDTRQKRRSFLHDQSTQHGR